MHLFYNQQYNKLRDQVNPNIHELEQFLHANEAYEQALDVLPGLKPRDSRLPHGKRAQFSSPPH